MLRDDEQNWVMPINEDYLSHLIFEAKDISCDDDESVPH
jgi:hypothetical protein